MPEELMLRFYPDRDDDLIAWLEGLPNEHGAKTLAAKALLRQSLNPEKDAKPQQTGLNPDDLLDVLLPAIRRIVVNVVRSELSSVQTIPSAPEQNEAEELETIERRLDQMNTELIGD